MARDILDNDALTEHDRADMERTVQWLREHKVIASVEPEPKHSVGLDRASQIIGLIRDCLWLVMAVYLTHVAGQFFGLLTQLMKLTARLG